VPVSPPATSRRTALLLALALPFGVAACADQEAGDPDTRELDRFLLTYVDALNREDSARLSTLLGGNHDGNAIISRLRRFGGQGLRDVQITHQRASSGVFVVFLRARAGSSGRPFEAREVAAWHRNRWTLTP
jgi:hypothetical protein